MINIKNEIYSVIKSIFVFLISNIILDFYKNRFDISKINLDSLVSTFVEYWWILAVIFILSFLRFKMHEKPHKIKYHHRYGEFKAKGPIWHDGKIWEIVVEEINPLINFNKESNIHYYVNSPRCPNRINNGELCLNELHLIDIGVCYLEKCDNCSFKRFTLKSHGREKSEILTKIEALILRKKSQIEYWEDLVELLKDEKKL